MNSVRPDLDNNMLDQIYNGKISEISLDKSSIIQKINTLEIPIDNIFNKYMDILKRYLVTVNLSDEECEKYFYKPKKISLDLYGTIELWFLVLMLNNITNTCDFNKRKIKIFNPERLDVLNKIMIIEENYLKTKR